MRKVLPAVIAAALLAVACTSGKYSGDKAAQALEAHLSASVDAPLKLDIRSLELTDSVSLATEFGRRTEIFQKRREKNEELYIKYKSQGLQKNSALKLEAVESDMTILKMLERMQSEAESLGLLDKTAYYIYRFTAAAKAGGKSTMYDNCYFSITPSGEVIAIGRQLRDISRSGGLAIPGYRELIKGGEEVQE